jgi:hypothetical protein
MLDLQAERGLMQSAEAKIRVALTEASPGQAASAITDKFCELQDSAARQAFVAVLASRVAIQQFRSQSSVSPT